MKKLKTSFKVLLSFLVCILVFTGAQAQITVASDGDVGIGTTVPVGKLHVNKTNNNSAYSAYFIDTDASSSTKNGIYNYVTSAGSGGRLGIRNYTFNQSTSSSNTQGFTALTRGGKGYTIGQYNSTSSTTGNTYVNFGHYNYMRSLTSNSGYAFYNNFYTPSGADGARYGIYNRVYNQGNGTSYALYSSMEGSGTGTRYAGYFNGNVHVVGTLTQTSDARTKENIVAVEGALGLISQLEPKSYTFKEDADLTVAEGQQYGFLAQELEKILPGLVKTIEQPIASGTGEVTPLNEEEIANGKVPTAMEDPVVGTKTLKSVNYIALIPILVQAVKEQQIAMEAQQEEIKALRKLLEEK
ncbi:MAG TPA: tail fiber domain-containing protein [Bacteroidetes bacterium]|nr:tail fiber domain-containing protein [Bacteroidota bacterium]